MADGARWRTRPPLVVLLAVVVLALSGCGSASEPSPPSGVDGLVIPTPSIDPEDFVEEIDNPWLPYERGSVWVYERSGHSDVEVSVLDEPHTVAGVATTAVQTRNLDGFTDADFVDYYAQDREGNVWWFGREGPGAVPWEAGVDGAEAGLAMAAHPRVGDGYRMGMADGIVADRAQVRSVSAEVEVPAGAYERCVEIETSSPLVPGVRLLSTYAEGVGLVRAVSLEGPEVSLELVEGP